MTRWHPTAEGLPKTLPDAGLLITGGLALFFLTYAGELGRRVAAGTQDQLRWVGLAMITVWAATRGGRNAGRLLVSQVLLVAFLLASLVSSLRSVAEEISIIKWALMAVQCISFGFVLPRTALETSWRLVLGRVYGLVAALVLLSTLGVSFLSAWIEAGRLRRFSGLLRMNPNTLGLLCVIALGFALWRLLNKTPWRWMHILIAGCALFTALLTQSRSALFGCVGVVLSWGLLAFPRRPALACAATLCLGVLVWSTLTRLDFVVSGLRRGEGKFFASRVVRWQAALEDFREDPGFGKGYGVSGLAREMELTGVGSVGAVIDGGGYPAVLGSVGLVGTMPFLLAILALAAATWSTLSARGHSVRRLYAGECASVAAGLLVNLWGEPWLLGPGNPVHLIFWVCIGGLIYSCSGRNLRSAPVSAQSNAASAEDRALARVRPTGPVCTRAL